MESGNLERILNESKSLPWRLLEINDQTFLFKLITNYNYYCFLLTDLSVIYYEHLSENEIEKKCSEMNAGLEMSLNRILLQLKKTLDGLENKAVNNLTMVQENNIILIKTETIVAGIPFFWTYTLKECDKIQIKDHLLMPILVMFAELQQRQALLFSIIKKKDLEIEDYKDQGNKLSRKYLETKVFDINQFLQERSNSEVLEESIEESIKNVFNKENDQFYTSVVTAFTKLDERAAHRQNEMETRASDENSTNEILSHTESEEEQKQKEKDLEILKRKELEKKLHSKPKNKKKKINL